MNSDDPYISYGCEEPTDDGGYAPCEPFVVLDGDFNAGQLREIIEHLKVLQSQSKQGGKADD